MKVVVIGVLLALFLPYSLRAEEVVPQEAVSPLTNSDVVTVYHRFGYEEADQPFRIKGPLLVERRYLNAFLELLARDSDVVVEVCPLKPLENHAFGFYFGKEERKQFCRIVSVRKEEAQTGESR